MTTFPPPTVHPSPLAPPQADGRRHPASSALKAPSAGFNILSYHAMNMASEYNLRVARTVPLRAPSRLKAQEEMKAGLQTLSMEVSWHF